jgi:uncharacterized protein (DUF1810 family)
VSPPTTTGSSDDSFDLARFVDAQTGAYENALSELQNGRKRSHWMWFIFPQLCGLGHSPTALRYGIDSIAEARAYLQHPLLGARLRACTEAVLAHPTLLLNAIFGSPDDAKFCSSMTLFALADATDDSPFRRGLVVFCAGQDDPKTLALLTLAEGEPPSVKAP